MKTARVLSSRMGIPLYLPCYGNLQISQRLIPKQSEFTQTRKGWTEANAVVRIRTAETTVKT